MSFCRNCGSSIKSSDVFCPSCGEQVKAAKPIGSDGSSIPSFHPPGSQPSYSQQSYPPAKNFF